MVDPHLNYTGLKTPTRGNVDRTITALLGTSQTLMGANPIRKRLILKNGANNAAINLNGGTAAIGGAGSITLLPYEGLVLAGDDCPKSAITIIGTINNSFSAFEGQ